jgi:peptidyl-prolyl cis-trans isomerase D
MMDSLRNAAKGWLAKLFIGLLAVSFGVWGIADVFRSTTGTALATVGSQEISEQQFTRAFQNYLQNYARQTGRGMTPEEARAMGIDKSLLDNMLRAAALDEEAHKLKLSVSDTVLAHDAMLNPSFQDAAGKFDAGRFKQLLQENGLTEQDYFAEERQRLLRQALTDTASANVPVNVGLIEALHRFETEQRDARYFTVSVQESDVTPPTDDDIKAEYEANPAAYTAPEYRGIATMKVEPADIASRVTLSDADIAAGFERYKTDYFTPETRTVLQLTFPTPEEATAAQQKLTAGTDFLALAKERGFSEQDVTFADKTKADFVDQAIAEAAFSLTEGELSQPVKGTLATVLLKAVKITPEKQATLDEVKPQLTERLRLERAGEEIQALYDAVEDARATQTSFEDIAAKAGIPFLLVPATDAQGLGKDGKPVTMPHPDQLLQAAFTSDVGVENDAISLDNGYVWYEVREVIPSTSRPLAEVKDEARAAVIAARLRTLVEEKAKKLVERAKSGVKLDELALETGQTVQTTQGLRRTESKPNFGPAAIAALFAVPDTGFAFALEPDGKSALVMQSQPVMLPPFVAGSAEAKATGDKIKDQLADDMLSAYLAALEQEAGVSINQTAWRNISGQQSN